MKTLKEHFDDLDRMIDTDAGKPKIRDQLEFIWLQVSKLEASYTSLQESHANLEEEHMKLQKAHSGLDTQLSAQANAQRREKQKKKRKIPPIQFEILNRLPTESEGNWPRIDEIARAVGIPVDETESHFDRLEESGLIERRYNAFDALIWHRTKRGNRFVLAMRLAGVEEAPKRKYPDLPDIEERMLAVMVGEDEGVHEEFIIHNSLQRQGVKITLEKVKWLLKTSLKAKGFADFGDEEGTYGAGNTWFITDRGIEYFAEREKL